MTQLVKLETPDLQGIEKSKAEQIRATFEPMAVMLEGFEAAFNSIITESQAETTKEVCVKAKRLRIDIGRVRIETGKLKDREKAEYLRAGKAIQGVHNILVWAVTDKENKLKEIENHFEIIEKKRLEALQDERVSLLSEFVQDAHERDLSSMDNDVWDAYFSTKKREYLDHIAAEKKAESDRIAKEKAEAEERIRIKKENERLKAEAIDERKIRDEKLRKERVAHDAAMKLERDKAAKLQAEIDAKAEKERLEEVDRLAKIEADLSKGDAAKLQDMLNDLEIIKTKYSFKSKKNQKLYSDVIILIDKIINHVG